MNPISTSSKPGSSPPPPRAEEADRFGRILLIGLGDQLRTKFFLTSFIGFQATLLLIVLTDFAIHGNGSDGPLLKAAIWKVLVVMLTVLIPLRGQSALGKDRLTDPRARFHLSKHDAWHTVGAKWGALVTVALLYPVAAAPYFTVLYFFGGVHLPADLGLLVLIVLLGAALTAIAIGLSGFHSVALRIAVAIGIVALLPGSLSIAEAIRDSPDQIDAVWASNIGGRWGILAGFVTISSITIWTFLRLATNTLTKEI